MFPLFRARFIQEPAWCRDNSYGQEALGIGSEDSTTEPFVRMAGCGPTAAVRGPPNFARPLMLDLNTLPREEGPPSESVLKRQKFAVFEKHCSQVADGLYVSGEAVARDRGILAQHNISHVVNCVGALYPEYFKADGIQYKTLWLQDHPQEDITCVLYDTFDFIEAAREGSNTAASRHQHQQQQQQQRPGSRVPPLALQQPQQQRFLQQQQQQLYASGAGAAGGSSSGGGHVLVHCSQGVSRSTTIAIAYLMWKTGGSYDEVYQAVRALRGVTSPNVGFMCQLINWAKRRQRPPTRVRLYRISPHCADAPLYLVPKTVSTRPGCTHPDLTQLDPRGCFVAHLTSKVYVWRGQQCVHTMLEAGVQAAARLSRYEGAPAAQVVQQGEEPDDLLAALAPSASGNSGCGDSSSCCTQAGSSAVSGEPSSNNLVGSAAGTTAGVGPSGGAQAAAAAAGGWSPGQQPDMDADMDSVPAAGVCPGRAQQGGPLDMQQQEQLSQQVQGGWPSQPAAAPIRPLTSESSQLRTASSAASAGGVVAAGSSRGSRKMSLSSPGGEMFAADAAAAAAAARELLGVQLGPCGVSLKALQPVAEYDGDFELWLSAQHSNSQPEGGRQTPCSPLAAAGGLWGDGGTGQSPKAESPAALEGRNKKYSRSDSEGRSVVPSCRQPGRLSTSSSQAWPDSSTQQGTAAAAACPSSSGVLAAGAAGDKEGWLPADGVVDMRQSSTDDSM